MHFFTEIELNPLSRQILSALPSQIAIVDEQGILVAHNERWDKAGKESQNSWTFPGLGDNILNVLQSPLEEKDYYALQLIVAYKSVLKGEKEKVTIQYEVQSEPKKWYSLTVSCLEHGSHFLLVNDDITADIKARKTLKEHNLKFLKQFENQLYGIVVADKNLTVRDLNETGCQILNCDRNQLIGQSLTQLLNIPVQLQKNIDDHYFDEVFLGESSLNLSNGQVLPVELNISHYTTPDGEQVVNMIFKDISAKKHAEAKLTAEQAFVNASIQSLPTAYFVIEQGGRLARWNKILEQELGYSSDELRDINIEKLVATEELGKIRSKMYALQKHESLNLEISCLAKSGKVLYYMVSGTWFEQDGKRYIVGGGINRNDFKRIELESLTNETYFTQLFEKSQVGMVLLDLNGNLEKCNFAFEEMMGYSYEELAGRKINKVLATEQDLPITEEVLADVKKGKIRKITGIRKHKDGSDVHAHISFIPVVVNDQIIASFGVFVDLTEQEQAKKIVSSQLHEKEVLIQEIHHRVKNNMAIISGIIELEGLNTDEPVIRDHLYKTLYRIQSISKIHEVMYKNQDLSSINFEAYLKELSTNFNNRNLGEIDFECSPNLVLNVNQAIPTGMLINEVTNQVVNYYDQMPDALCSFYVTVNEDNQRITLRFALPKTETALADIVFDNTLSAELISVILKQLEAEVNRDLDCSYFEINFQMNPNQRGAHNSLL